MYIIATYTQFEEIGYLINSQSTSIRISKWVSFVNFSVAINIDEVQCMRWFGKISNTKLLSHYMQLFESLL